MFSLPDQTPNGHLEKAPEVYRGDRLVQEALVAFNQMPRLNQYGYDFNAMLGRAANFVQRLAVAEPGTPVLRIRPKYDLGRDVHLGGTLASPAILHGSGAGRWLTVPITCLDYGGKPVCIERSLLLSDLWWEFKGDQPNIALGEQQVRELLERKPLYGLTVPNPPEDILKKDAQWLYQLAQSGLPVDFLGLDSDQRELVCNQQTHALLTSQNREVQNIACQALYFIAGAETPEQKADLLESLNHQLASRLPLAPKDDDSAIYASFALAAQQPPLPILYETLPDGTRKLLTKVPNLQVLHAGYLSRLYEMRAQQISHWGVGIEERVDIPGWPDRPVAAVEARLPHTFAKPSATDEQIRQDVDYFLRLRTAGVPPDTSLGVSYAELDADDFVRLRQARVAMLGLMTRTRSLQQRVDIFCALEYLFNIKRPQQRDYFYELMSRQHSYRVPVHTSIGLGGQPLVAEAMAAVMPNPPLGRRAPRAANAAALMADFYRRKALRVLRKELRRYRPLEAGEESSGRAEVLL